MSENADRIAGKENQTDNLIKEEPKDHLGKRKHGVSLNGGTEHGTAGSKVLKTGPNDAPGKSTKTEGPDLTWWGQRKANLKDPKVMLRSGA